MDQPTPKSSIFDAMSPKQSFLFGSTAGFLILCTVGFFILLGMFLSGNGIANAGSGSNGKTLAVNTGTTPTTPTQPTEIRVGEVTADDHARGSEKPDVTIVEFSDLDCPYCQRFHGTMQQIVADNDNVQWVYRHFPLDSLHPNARTKALGSECAAEQGKFWEYTDAVSVATGEPASEATDVARQLGLNMTQFESCLDSKKYAAEVQADTADAQAAGGRGTPYSIAIGPDGETQVISGAQPIETVQAIIDALAN